MTSPSSTLVDIRGLEKKFDLSGGLLEQISFKGGRFHRKQEAVHAINGVDLQVQKGEALCVVGESGCGKSTVARTVMGLLSPSAGEIHYDGQRIDHLDGKEVLPYRRKMQMIFQNPYASLNPRMTIQQTLEEPIRFHQPDASESQIRDKVQDVMESVGIDPDWGSRFGHEFSGGQRQRIAIARALAVDPDFIVADEPISALDVSIQAQVLNLMMELQADLGLSFLFISHDMAVVERVSHDVAVMYLGRIVEIGPRAAVFENPQHPYTKALIKAVPVADPQRRKGEKDLNFKPIPSPIHPVGHVPEPSVYAQAGTDHFVLTTASGY